MNRDFEIGDTIECIGTADSYVTDNGCRIGERYTVIETHCIPVTHIRVKDMKWWMRIEWFRIDGSGLPIIFEDETFPKLSYIG